MTLSPEQKSVGNIRIEIPMRETSESWSPWCAFISLPSDLTREEAERIKGYIDSSVKR